MCVPVFTLLTTPTIILIGIEHQPWAQTFLPCFLLFLSDFSRRWCFEEAVLVLSYTFVSSQMYVTRTLFLEACKQKRFLSCVSAKMFFVVFCYLVRLLFYILIFILHIDFFFCIFRCTTSLYITINCKELAIFWRGIFFIISWSSCNAWNADMEQSFAAILTGNDKLIKWLFCCFNCMYLSHALTPILQ